MSKIKIIYLLVLVIIFNGCNSGAYDSVRSQMAGNIPHSFFHFSTSYDANNYMFHQKILTY